MSHAGVRPARCRTRRLGLELRRTRPPGMMATTGGETERVQLVVMAATVTRAPVDLGADNRRTGPDFAAAGEGPQNGTGAGIQRVHVGPRTGVGIGVDDAVGHAYVPGI